jgi:putative oxidoreductase
MFEIGCGILLLVPWTRRIGALAVALVCVVFFLALLSALVRGLVLDCGCFGSEPPSRPRMWLELGLDMVLFSGALFVYLRLLRSDSDATISPSAFPSSMERTMLS